MGKRKTLKKRASAPARGVKPASAGLARPRGREKKPGRAVSHPLPAVGVVDFGRPNEPTKLELQREADRLVSKHYAPAGVIINDRMEVIQFRGHVSPYLKPVPGSAPFNILKMAREGLAAKLRSAVARARKTGAQVRTDALRVRSDGGLHRVRLEVLPIGSSPPTRRHYLVLFEPVASARGQPPASRAPDRKTARGRETREDDFARLERELAATREYLQSIIERQEASNEEPRSANAEEAELRASEERYRQLFESAREGILIVDAATGALLEANPYLLELVGYEMAELLGKELWELPFMGDPEAVRIGFKELASNGFSFDADLVLRSKSGETIHVESISSVYQSGSQKVAQYNLRDITARQQAEEQTRLQKGFTAIVVDSSLDGILAFDRNSNLIVWNVAMERIFGVRKEDALGRNAFEVLPVLKSIGEEEYFAQALAGQNVTSEDRPYVSTTGRQGFFEGHYSPLRDEGGRIVGGLATIREITSRKQFEDHLRQLQKLESLGTLSGGIAHDFNNLLNIISAYAALLAKEGGKKSAPRLEAINKAVDRGAALVRQLLTFARKSEVRFETVDVDAVVEDLGKLLKETFPKKFEVKLELADELPAISADPNQLHQALLNLCVNARDAMPGGGTLTLKTGVATQEQVRSRFSEAPEALYVLVAVADDGAGMDEATRSRLFEPFFTTKDKGRGAGLGLALVYGIVKSHMGYIDVETGIGRGSEFRIYMPVGAIRAEPREAKPVLQASPRDAAGSETILFAEDEEMLASAVKSLLEAEGYTVLTAKDGVEALDLYRRRRRDIAISILDLQMPRLGGWETCLKIRGIDPAARVVIASGDLDQEHRVQMRKAGIEGSIRKPYSAVEIMKVVRRILDLPAGA